MRLISFVFLATLGLLTLEGCSKSKGPKRCYSAVDCAGDEVCTELPSGARTCLAECDTAAAATCTDGKACVSLPLEDAHVDVCLPGGSIAEFAACGTSVECVAGAVCVQRNGQPNARCEKLCTVGAASVCMGSQVCTAIDVAVSSTRGTCIVP